jgi:uncharacterized protein with HEPN domain
MRHLEVLKYLQDISESILLLEEFRDSVPDFHAFAADQKTLAACERKLEVRGEALNRILKKEPTIEISNLKKIVHFRNKLAHEYGDVDYRIVWNILKSDLNMLKKEIDQLIANYSANV